MKVEVRACVHPSENPEKVASAVKNIFPDLTLTIEDKKVKGDSTDSEILENFKDRLGLQAIRDSARRELKNRRKENSLQFLLNKQAATVSKISFSNGNTPLGSIKVKIESDNLDELIDHLAPSKKKRKS